MTAQKIYVGRRKESVARVRLIEGKNAFMINGRKLDDFIHRIDHKESVLNVLKLCNLDKKISVYARVNGGGITGQKDALRLAIARGIVEKYPEFKPVMKENGLLTRDPREKERRKYGLAKARKRYQFSKR
ncbi:MAG: 30S ribosomal protein S9 [bacterium]|nr:30S ribosomal protein S9 [bacterium]